MIHLFDQMSLPFKKKVMLILLSLFIIIFLLFIVKDDTVNEDDHFLHIKMLSFLLPLMITWITIDMIHPHDRMLESYFGLSYVFNKKVENMMIYSFLFAFTYYAIYLQYQMIFHQTLPKLADLYMVFHLSLDLLMVSLASLILAKKKHPTIGFIIPIAYIMIMLITEYQQNDLLYLFIPIFQPIILGYNLALPYKVCYICLGYTIYHLFTFKS